MRLLLIRHGQTTNNVSGALDTAIPGAELTPLGQAQAQAVPEALADVPVAGIYASRLVRTQMTAAPLASVRRLDVVVRPGLEEISAGELELRRDPDARQAYIDTLAAWMTGDLGHAMPGGPDGHHFLGRYAEAIDAVVGAHDDDATVAVVSHGAAIRVFSAIAAGIDVERADGMPLLNTGMATLRTDGSRWSLEEWHSDPLGGHGLEDTVAVDPTGDRVPTHD
ncbi:putative phosphoglycerate mutase [Mumia flava]|uniref:Putative phosphoglycerate mutase n=1 Tax=Mumia flava TaxID=1348852 RepID=A0A0B2B257_9ACTN|nr:histidine phosphatase family protein [Mumia flava]PJJ57771.1 putative phosphoglycerate mutase [Mumia flava]